MNFKQFIQESAVDIARNTLDTTVFQFPDQTSPIMHPQITLQIFQDMKKMSDVINVMDYFVSGSILTKHYNKDSDIDVTVVVDNEELADNMTNGRLMNLLNVINGKMATGTTHPINYFILTTEFDETKYNGIYDPRSEKWLKIPKETSINAKAYLEKFHKAVNNIDLMNAQLRRELIDFDELGHLNKDEISDLKILVQSKLYEISKTVDSMVDIKKSIKKSRTDAFNRPLSPTEIQKFKDKNNLPENVIYKMIERYYYWDFINKLEQILDAYKGDKIDPQAIEDIKKAENEFNILDSFELFDKTTTFITEKLKSIRLKKIDWKNPNVKSHLMKMYRGMNRKNLSQVPNSKRPASRYASWRNLGTAKKIVDIAKKASSGIWRVSALQVRDIAAKYHHFPPTAKHNIKHLGNTGIIVWYKGENNYFLIKPSKMLRK